MIQKISAYGRVAVFGIVIGLSLLGLNALAQQAPGAIKVTSLVGAFVLDIVTSGPQAAKLPLNGGTFTCTNGGTITVANTNVDAGSIVWITLKTVGGTPAQPFLATITPGTGFTATCGGSDSSVYNYVVVG